MVLALFLGAGFGSAMADDITADTLTYDGKNKVATAEGNVVAHVNEGAEVTASRGEYHFQDRSAVLEGGVTYTKGNSRGNADTMYLYTDKTVRGVGSVFLYDGDQQRTLKGDDVMYNSSTGYGKIDGNGYVSAPDGTVEAPHIEGNIKQIKVVATGGVNISSPANNMTGYGDQAVYTRTGQNGTDGQLVLSGNAWAEQNGNSFRGPELIMKDADQAVEAPSRSTLVITNTGAPAAESDNSGGSGSSVPQGPVTAATPIAGRPPEAGAPLELKGK